MEILYWPLSVAIQLISFGLGYLSDDPFYLVLLVAGSFGIWFVWKRVK